MRLSPPTAAPRPVVKNPRLCTPRLWLLPLPSRSDRAHGAPSPLPVPPQPPARYHNSIPSFGPREGSRNAPRGPLERLPAQPRPRRPRLTRPLHTEETRRERSGDAGITGTSPTAPCYRLTKWRRHPARLTRASIPLATGDVILMDGAGITLLRRLAPWSFSTRLLAAGGARGGSQPQCVARLDRLRDTAGRSHLESGKDAEMPHASAILIGGRAWNNLIGSHLKYGQGRQRAHCVIIRGAAWRLAASCAGSGRCHLGYG